VLLQNKKSGHTFMYVKVTTQSDSTWVNCAISLNWIEPVDYYTVTTRWSAIFACTVQLIVIDLCNWYLSDLNVRKNA